MPTLNISTLKQYCQNLDTACKYFPIAAETEQDGASSAMLLVRQNGHDGNLVVVQAKVSPTTFALREVLIEQQKEQQAAVASLAVLPGCNRTADMQYEFVVGLHVPQTLWQTCPQAVGHALCTMTSGTGADCFCSLNACLPMKALDCCCKQN